jgi:uncharacterized protein
MNINDMIQTHWINEFMQLAGISKHQLHDTLQLFEAGATIPFIARYRKEKTGGLTDEQLFDLKKRIREAEKFIDRKKFIVEKLIEKNAPAEVMKALHAALLTDELEDIYLPYKEKKKSRAQRAIDAGLKPLADALLENENNAKKLLHSFHCEQYPTDEEVLKGARDILAESISEHAIIRQQLRNLFLQQGILSSSVVKARSDEAVKFKDYFSYSEKIRSCAPHRLLAVLRGANEKMLRISVAPDEKTALTIIRKIWLGKYPSCSHETLTAIADAYERLLLPSLENETLKYYKHQADVASAKMFAVNLRQLLLAAPLGQKNVLAIDPGFRTGCKIVCLDKFGNLLHNEIIFPHEPQHQHKQALNKLSTLINQYQIDAIAIGNGTAGRETEQLIQRLRFERKVQVFSVNEDGASVYSASSEARQEFPDYDVTVRGAVSIGRRLMDPLAELIKIDPKALGIGQYQHDIEPQLLEEELHQTIEHCVNTVGVNLNTASEKLLTYVSGLGPTMAKKIVASRGNKGFTSRQELLTIKGLGRSTFEQAAGFLRIPQAANPLDNSAVHPDHYSVVEQMADSLKMELHQLSGNTKALEQINLNKFVTSEIGLPTLNDILDELRKPGRDVRGIIKVFEFDKTIRKISDLKEGMILPGIITNLTHFGAFVDIGIKQDGLVHVSQLTDAFTKDVAAVVKLNQQVKVKVLSVDEKSNRIQFSMKGVVQ